MVIEVRRHLSGCDTNEQGDILFELMKEQLEAQARVEVSFLDMLSASSSFVNSAFVPLLETMSFDDVKRQVRIIQANPQIADMIRKRMAFESARIAA
jgi:hypothetical protein